MHIFYAGQTSKCWDLGRSFNHLLNGMYSYSYFLAGVYVKLLGQKFIQRLVLVCSHDARIVRVSEWFSFTAFFRTVDIEVHIVHTSRVVIAYTIQIKICAEYRDMLPRPRLVCQEPGLRPIGRSPGVPDKSSRGLGSMSRYSAQILICFIAYIFLFLLLFPLWVWLGTVQDCHHAAQCPLPLAIVIRMRLAIRQSKLPACLAEVQLAF